VGDNRLPCMATFPHSMPGVVLCAALADQVRQQLAPGGLPQQQWPALDVLLVTSRLQQQCRTQHRDKLQAQSSSRTCTPPSSSESSVRDALGLQNGNDMESMVSTTSSGSSEGAQQQSGWVYSPPNPNAANTNHAVVHLCQVGGRLRAYVESVHCTGCQDVGAACNHVWRAQSGLIAAPCSCRKSPCQNQCPCMQ
jgi:hypothetical protein